MKFVALMTTILITAKPQPNEKNCGQGHSQRSNQYEICKTKETEIMKINVTGNIIYLEAKKKVFANQLCTNHKEKQHTHNMTQQV